MNAQYRFAEAVDDQINYFRKEYDLTYFEAIGVLTHLANNLSVEVNNAAEDEDDTEVWDG